MPNHFQGILCIVENRKPGGDQGVKSDRVVGDREKGDREKGDRQVAPTGPKTKSFGAIMAGFRSAVIKRINTIRDTPGTPVWERNYVEHIIRDDTDSQQIAEHIANTPRIWKEDKLNPVTPPPPQQ